MRGFDDEPDYVVPAEIDAGFMTPEVYNARQRARRLIQDLNAGEPGVTTRRIVETLEELVRHLRTNPDALDDGPTDADAPREEATT
jgi:hypothetical protein